MSVESAVKVLTERRNWLTARIAAKNQVGWDIVWDTRERDALSVAITELERGDRGGA